MQRLRLWLLKRLLPAAYLQSDYRAVHVHFLIARRLFDHKVTLAERAAIANHIGHQAHIAAAQAVNNIARVDWEAEKRARTQG